MRWKKQQPDRGDHPHVVSLREIAKYEFFVALHILERKRMWRVPVQIAHIAVTGSTFTHADIFGIGVLGLHRARSVEQGKTTRNQPDATGYKNRGYYVSHGGGCL